MYPTKKHNTNITDLSLDSCLSVLSFLLVDDIACFSESSKSCKIVVNDPRLWKQLYFRDQLVNHHARIQGVSEKENVKQGCIAKKLYTEELIKLFPSPNDWAITPIIDTSHFTGRNFEWLIRKVKGHKIVRAWIQNKPTLLLCVKNNINKNIFGNAEFYFDYLRDNKFIFVERLAKLQITMVSVGRNNEPLIDFKDANNFRNMCTNREYVQRLIKGEPCGESPFPAQEGNRKLGDGSSVIELSDQSEFDEVNKRLLTRNRPRFK